MRSLLVQSCDRWSSETDDLLDTVLPLDQWVVVVPGIKGADGLVGLECDQCFAATDCLWVMRTVEWQDVSQTVDLSKPDGIGDVGMAFIALAYNARASFGSRLMRARRATVPVRQGRETGRRGSSDVGRFEDGAEDLPGIVPQECDHAGAQVSFGVCQCGVRVG